ncbi:MAG TPA: prepilin-type N-terminal cleavage/methylation domain-containing protein [Thermoanaerobaculia bacterium]|nr:prepilin-type N-terminal cleavage/methylation domain-containing protein [Thermoanaerobaculia bacterium]
MDVEVSAGKPGEAGFSMIEALIAAAILLIIAIGLIPMFTQSILNNAAGSDYTTSSVHAKDELENLQDAAFHNEALVIDSGDVELLTTDFWLPGTAGLGDELWTDTVPSGSEPRWTRTTGVTQYSIIAFDDGMLADAERKNGNAQPTEVHFKIIEVRLANNKAQSGLPPGPSLVYRMIKPF